MTQFGRVREFAFILGLSVLCVALPRAIAGETPGNARNPAQANYSFAKLPLAFEPNLGQAPQPVKFISRARGGTLFLTSTGATFAVTRRHIPNVNATISGVSANAGAGTPVARPVVESHAMRISFSGANRNAASEGLDRLPGVTNYFVGKEPGKWHTGIPNYARARFHRIYRGIDLVFYGTGNGFEYDFVVAPGAHPGDICLRLEGTDKAELNRNGDLIISFGGERLSLRKPVLYQQVNHHRRDIRGAFVKVAKSTYRIRVGKYDRKVPLVIDPALVWASYVGGDFLDVPYRVANDASSNPYFTGLTCSSNFPEPTIGSAMGGCDGFVAKLDAATGSVRYFAIIGGSGFDNSLAIAVDPGGNAYVAGQTYSTDFPAPAGQDSAMTLKHGIFDAFVAKLDPNGNLLWSRLVGGSTPTADFLNLGWSLAFGVAVPQNCAPTGTPCNVYLVGQTTTTDFPTANAFQTSNPNLWNGFITKISSDGTQMPYSTYFGGEPAPGNDGSANWAYSVAVDGAGRAYVAGGSDVATIHTTRGRSYQGTRDTWVAMFDPTLSGTATRVWATFIGGSSRDDPGGIALEPNCTSPCATYVSGTTNSDDLPITSGAYQTAFGGGQNGFAAKLDGSGALVLLTYLGDAYGFNGAGISVDSSGSPYIVGTTSSPFFPLTESIQGPQLPLSILLKSTDGGNTFGSVPIPVNASAVQGIAIDPSSTSTVYAGTNQNGLWKSTNGGGAWQQIGLVGQYARPAIDPNDSSIVYAATGNGVMRSTNSGGTFNPTSLTPNVVTAFAFDTSTNPSTVYASTEVDSAVPGSTGQVFESTDGTTFAALPGLSVASVNDIAFDPNTSAVYAATSLGPYVTSNFAPTGSMTTPREFMQMALLNDGRILIPGGFRDLYYSPPLASADLYDPATGTFTATAGSLHDARGFYTATTLPSTLSANANKVLITGGYDGTNALSSAELYDPNTQQFTYTGSMLNAHSGHTATLLNDGSVVVISDCCAERYDPLTESFSFAGYMLTPRYGHTATLITSGVNAGKVLVAGGIADSNQSTLTSAELWDPANGGSFAATGSMTYPRNGHVAAPLPDGRVLIAGGESANYPGPGVLQAEIYNPDNENFADPAPSIDVTRIGAAAVALPGAKVIILSGNNGYSNSATALVYDENTNKFTSGGLMTTWRNGFPAVLLQTGKVLMAGANRGSNQDADQTAELYDPNSFGFISTGQHFSPAFAVAVDPTTNPSTVYASFLQGILRLNDGYWIDFGRTNPYGSIALDTSTTPATLYAGNGNGEIITSTNQGTDFKVQNLANYRPSNLSAVAATASAPGLVYAASFEQFDWFVFKLDPSFATLQFSSYLGGSAGDYAQDVAVAPSGNVYVVGGSGSSDFLGASGGSLTGNTNPVVAKLPNSWVGNNVTVQPDPTTNVTYTSVTSGGQTTATTDTAPPSLPPNFDLVTSADITTTATYTASDADPIVVCLRYNPSAVTNPQNLSLMHYVDGMWTNVTTSNDTVNGLICGGVTTLSPFAVVKGIPISVSIMIKPPSTAPASLNLTSNGNIPVAILSSSTFDATKVQPSTIQLDGDNVKLKGNGGYQCSSQDVNGDGKPDLICQVPIDQFQAIPGSDEAILTAVTTSNQYIQGSEAITIVKQ